MSKLSGSLSAKNIERLTLAYFSASPGGSYNWEKWQMWRGISEAAKQLNINLLYIAGEEFESQPQAVLYDLVGSHNVDGIIAWNSFVGPRTSKKVIQEFIDHYHPLPVVSIEIALEGCSNILLDEKQAVRDLLAHLIGDHHYHRIAFLSQELSHPSTSRQQAFEEVMEEYGLLDSRLIGSLEVLNDRGVTPGIDYEVLVAHADDEAVKAVDAFRKRGLRVPEDIAITGFNDGMDARGLLPPLTTVRLPFRRMGRKAVEILVERVVKKEVHEPVIFPVQLILRRSCGCVEPMAEKAWLGFLRGSNLPLRAMLEVNHQEIVDELSSGMGTPVENTAKHWAEKFLDLFADELLDHISSPSQIQLPSSYLIGLQSILQQAVEEGANVSRWHEALTALRKVFIPLLSNEERVIAEDLWQQARVLIGQSAVRAEINHNWRAEQRGDILREMESELLISFDFNDLLNVLAKGLSRLELNDLYLVLYENPDKKDGLARLVLAYRRDKETWMNAEGIRFDARDILPEGWIPDENAYQLLIEDLHLGSEQIGYVLFHTGPPGTASMSFIYQALQIQLSSAVKGVKLRQKLQEALRQAEEANQLKSGFLSMVSHELRTPLNLIVGLSEMAMRQKTRSTRSSQENLYKYLEQIYVSGQHLDRLIRDVLDLASSQVGQMSLVCQSLDLLPVLMETSDMGRQLAEQKNLQFIEVFPSQLAKIWGDKTRLKQILLNLISNAIKFTAHGEIRFTASQKEGEILISVKDTGLGIAQEEQDVIFDEFHQTNRSMVRGYGGIGLGLAITRRLVEMHGGRIWVESRGAEGSGSTFTFTLPVLAQSLVPETLPVNSREGVVLVLTKEEEASHTLTEHLKKIGFNVEEQYLSDDVDIVGGLVAAPPGAVILDITPATEQGWMIIKNLKENPATQDLPVLFYSLMEEQTTGTVLEMDYLPKPVGTDQLIRALKRHGLKTGARGSEQNILMIDDDPGILELQSRMIETRLPGCRVLTAQDARRGMELMRKEAPDLLLLDLMMPEIDGFTVLKMMQEEPALRNIPVIVLSAQVLTRHDIQRLNQGVASVLSKGMFEPQEILSRVESVLSRNQKLGSEAQRLVYQAIGYIHEHYRDPISRTEIARYLNINEQYLSRCFNKIIGIGPMAYLSRHRILQAKKLLDRKNFSVTQVALEVGLSSQSYFSRIFQQEVGVTPSEYMRGKRAAEVRP